MGGFFDVYISALIRAPAKPTGQGLYVRVRLILNGKSVYGARIYVMVSTKTFSMIWHFSFPQIQFAIQTNQGRFKRFCLAACENVGNLSRQLFFNARPEILRFEDMI